MRVGVLVFLGAIALSVVIGLLGAFVPNLSSVLQWLLFLMLLLGIVAGHLNITKEEERDFLLAGIAFIVSLQVVLQVSQLIALVSRPLFDFIGQTLFSLMVFSAGALILLAIRMVIDLIRD